MTHLAPIEGRAGSAFGAGRRKLGVSTRRHLGEVPAAYLLLAPVIILFAFAVVYPLIDTIRLSFYDIKGLYPPRFAGLNNFVTLYNDANFRQAAVTTLLWTTCTTVLSVSAAPRDRVCAVKLSRKKSGTPPVPSWRRAAEMRASASR